MIIKENGKDYIVLNYSKGNGGGIMTKCRVVYDSVNDKYTPFEKDDPEYEYIIYATDGSELG